MNRKPVGVAAAMVMIGVLAGCGGSGDEGGPAAPTTSAAAPATTPSGPTYLGPAGYGALKLGMKPDQAQATGLITIERPPPEDFGCGAFKLKKFPDGSGGYVSARLGVASIFASGDMSTPEHIKVGSTLAQVKQAYPALETGPNSSFVKVPGNEDAVYSFLIDNGRVTELVLDLAKQDCHN